MSWLLLHIPATAANAETVADALQASGAVSVTFRDRADEPILEPALGETPLWRQTRVTGMYPAGVDTRHIDQQLRPLLPDSAESHWEQLEDRDWQREWMQRYQPIDCGHKLWICPSWLSPPDPCATNVLLDPGLAFGTGTHPTTLLCLQWLATQNLDQATVVDYGCGSGILAIAALLRGADRALATDVDPQALLASRDNAARNGLAPKRILTCLPGQLPPVHADVVFANILAAPLIELAPILLALVKPGGNLCLSGIIASQADAVIAAYRQQVAFDPPAARDEWLRLSGTRHC